MKAILILKDNKHDNTGREVVVDVEFLPPVGSQVFFKEGEQVKGKYQVQKKSFVVVRDSMKPLIELTKVGKEEING